MAKTYHKLLRLSTGVVATLLLFLFLIIKFKLVEVSLEEKLHMYKVCGVGLTLTFLVAVGSYFVEWFENEIDKIEK